MNQGINIKADDSITADGTVAVSKSNNIGSIIATVAIMVSSTAIVWYFNDDIKGYGSYLLNSYGQDWIDVFLFLLTSVSCTPLVLPVWGYVLIGMGMGFGILRLATVMAFGSATGSLVTYFIGKFFSNNNWVKKKFPTMLKHPWTHGKSKKYVTWILLVGTASPIPCDVLYAACGAKRFPPLVFYITMVAGRFVRYTYLAVFFKYFTT